MMNMVQKMKQPVLMIGLSLFMSTLLADVKTLNINDLAKNAPKEVPNQLILDKTQDGKRINGKTLTYLYDKEGRVKEIKSSTDDYTFKYSYANNNLVNRVVVIFRDNGYVQADFTYDKHKHGIITEIKRSGQQQGKVKLSYDYQTASYTWTDSRVRKNTLKIINRNRILEHHIGNSAFRFDYDLKASNGIENLTFPITLTTYLAMDYLNTDFYQNGFFQGIMGKPLLSIVDPRENGRMYLFENKNGLYRYLQSSAVKDQNGVVNTWRFSYREPIIKLQLNEKTLKDKEKLTKSDLSKFN